MAAVALMWRTPARIVAPVIAGKSVGCGDAQAVQAEQPRLVHPNMPGYKAVFQREGLKISHGVLMRVLSMDRLAGSEGEQVAVDAHGLERQAVKMHFDAATRGIV